MAFQKLKILKIYPRKNDDDDDYHDNDDENHDWM